MSSAKRAARSSGVAGKDRAAARTWTTEGLALLTGIILMFVVGLCHLMYLRSGAGIDKAVAVSVEESELRPTVFRIFDKSSDETCDRLIQVLPMDWYVWACYGQLYILNPEGSDVRCASGDTPAVRVLGIDNYVATCINANYDTLIRSYRTSGRSRVVPYELESQTFTIFSALNLLAREWLTFELSGDEDPRRFELRSVQMLVSDTSAESLTVESLPRGKRDARRVAGMFSDKDPNLAAADDSDAPLVSPKVSEHLLRERLKVALRARRRDKSKKTKE